MIFSKVVSCQSLGTFVPPKRQLRSEGGRDLARAPRPVQTNQNAVQCCPSRSELCVTEDDLELLIPQTSISQVMGSGIVGVCPEASLPHLSLYVCVFETGSPRSGNPPTSAF